jgi:hypothetical protein
MHGSLRGLFPKDALIKAHGDNQSFLTIRTGHLDKLFFCRDSDNAFLFTAVAMQKAFNLLQFMDFVLFIGWIGVRYFQCHFFKRVLAQATGGETVFCAHDSGNTRGEHKEKKCQVANWQHIILLACLADGVILYELHASVSRFPAIATDGWSSASDESPEISTGLTTLLLCPSLN